MAPVGSSSVLSQASYPCRAWYPTGVIGEFGGDRVEVASWGALLDVGTTSRQPGRVPWYELYDSTYLLRARPRYKRLTYADLVVYEARTVMLF